MTVVRAKPTSAGRRFRSFQVDQNIHKGKPHSPLLATKSKNGGRNNRGRITVRHQGGGHKQHYRIIDFKRTKDGIRDAYQSRGLGDVYKRQILQCSFCFTFDVHNIYFFNFNFI